MQQQRVMATMYRLGQINTKYPQINLDKAASQSNVKLKNNGVLPLSKEKYSKFAIMGNDAYESNCNSIGDCSCVGNGNAIFKGYGSGTTTFKYIVTLYDAISKGSQTLGINLVIANKNLEQEDLISETPLPTDPDYLWSGTRRLISWSSGNIELNAEY